MCLFINGRNIYWPPTMCQVLFWGLWVKSMRHGHCPQGCPIGKIKRENIRRTPENFMEWAVRSLNWLETENRKRIGTRAISLSLFFFLSRSNLFMPQYLVLSFLFSMNSCLLAFSTLIWKMAASSEHEFLVHVASKDPLESLYPEYNSLGENLINPVWVRCLSVSLGGRVTPRGKSWQTLRTTCGQSWPIALHVCHTHENK